MIRSQAQRLSIATLGLMVTLVGFAGIAEAEAPEPQLVPNAWQFEFDYGKPRLILVESQYYWYLPYTVTNRTGQDRLFIPDITVMADNGQMVAAGRKVPPAVFNAIKAEQRNPLLLSPVDVIGRLLQGEDNARDSVAVWPALPGDVDHYDVFFGGISGETAVVQNPRTDEMTVLRKSLHLTFVTPGTPAELIGQPIEQVREQWVMR